MTVQYVNHLPHEYRLSGLDLYVDALRDKLMPILGTAEDARRVLAPHMSPGNCLAAVWDDRIVGLLAIQTRERSFLNPTLTRMIQVYGIWKGLFKMAGLTLLHHAVAPTEWYIDGFAVARDARGKGIGSRLMERMATIARQEGVRTITLDVLDTNTRAIHLYNKLGFYENRRENLWPMNAVFGFPFNTSIFMVLPLDSPGLRADTASTSDTHQP